MRLGEPLQVRPGYAIDDTRFYQHEHEVNRADVKSKLGNAPASAESIERGQTFETLALLTRVPGSLLLILGIDGLLPNSYVKMSKSTTTGLLLSAAGALGVSIGFTLAAESNYVDATAHYNARFRPSVPREQSARPSSDNEAKPEEFPQNVAGYSFHTGVREAEAVCRRGAQRWTLTGSEALCSRSDRSNKDARDVQLRFAIGALSGVTILYESRAEVLNRDYVALARGMRAKYGKPQVDAPPPPGDCATALAQCLADGNKMQPIVWSSPRGSVELEPVWRNEHALIELRYLQNDDPTQ